jgi:hypothetical protein
MPSKIVDLSARSAIAGNPEPRWWKEVALYGVGHSPHQNIPELPGILGVDVFGKQAGPVR